jgi:hypothetical protein
MDMISLGLPEYILNSLWHHFHVLISKDTWFSGFSFDSNFADDA